MQLKLPPITHYQTHHQLQKQATRPWSPTHTTVGSEPASHNGKPHMQATSSLSMLLYAPLWSYPTVG